ncbi:MAG: DUF4870 domain-containing protein [Bacillota bacterium]|nr:DUF4870 domain-containing protein [Bacillota bacterium]MDP4171604.1 DUF4870 domain-containing protein [Bacillota bacterium]
MGSRKILSALCYFSLFFASFIFPLVVFFASDDDTTKKHAKKAFISHLIPLITLPLIVFGLFFDRIGHGNHIPVFAFFAMGLFGLTSFVVMIWNIVKGVRVLTKE